MTNEPIACDRCKADLSTRDAMAGALLLTFESPLMATPSPPTFLCNDCSDKVVEFIFPAIAEERRERIR